MKNEDTNMEPLAKLADILGFEPGECTDINSLATHAVAEIERLEDLTTRTPSEREQRFMQFISDRDEARSREYAAFLQSRDDAEKLGISALAIFELVAESTRAYLCNFNSMTDGNGTEMEIADAIEEITSRAEFEFHRITGIDHITGSRDAKLKRKHLQ